MTMYINTKRFDMFYRFNSAKKLNDKINLCFPTSVRWVDKGWPRRDVTVRGSGRGGGACNNTVLRVTVIALTGHCDFI